MCGIAGFHVKDPNFIKKHEGVEVIADELLKSIESRGKHASGFVSVGFDGKVMLDKAAKTATEFIKDRERIPAGVRTVLLHTRHWTKGDPKNTENNHPVVYKHCFAVHNGHINNDDEVFEETQLVRTAEVDSIAIPALITYHGINEFEDIKVALEALEGGFATAIIDPIAAPGRVILAKGSQSPLYVVDHPKFVVWASTQSAIKDAWAKVLGTPPDDKKIESITEGNFIVLDGSEVSRETFTVKRRPIPARQSWQGPTQRNGTTPGNNGKPFGFGQFSKVDETPVVQAREAIEAFIKSGGAARHFDDQQNGVYTDDDFKDVVGNRRWHPCYGCDRLVLEEDRVKHPDWGTICTDCYTATKREIARAEAEMQDTEYADVCAGTSVPRINRADRDALEVWADHELHLHREVLESMAKDLGSFYSTQAIEFLTWFTTPEYREVAGSAVNNLITELRELYEYTYMDVAAEAFGEACAVPLPNECSEDGCDNPRAENSFKCGIHKPKPVNSNPLQLEAGTRHWGFCHEHNRAFPRTEGCPQCVAVREAELDGEARLAQVLDSGWPDEEESTDATTTEGVYLPWERGRDIILTNSTRKHTRSSGGATKSTEGNAADDSGGEVIDLPRCGSCKTFVLRATESGCVVCKQSAADDAKDAGSACLACANSDPEYEVGYAGKTYHYCKSCYTTCGKIVKGEVAGTVELCHAATNHMLKSGLRVCHQHARRQSDCVSDTTLRKRGATITEGV